MSSTLEGFEGPIFELATTLEEYRRRDIAPVTTPVYESALARTIIAVTVHDEKQMAWRSRAACLGPQSVYFFSPSDFNERKDEKEKREAIAKRICNSCSVIEQCLEEALTKREDYGIWGGKNEEERKQMLGIKTRKSYS